MAEFVVRRHLAAPPDVVFFELTDFAHAPQRIRGITKTEILTPGPVGLGTKVRETRMMFKREATETMEVVAFEPPRLFALGCENHGCRYRAEYRLSPSGSETEIEMRFRAEPISWIAKVMAFLMKPLIQSCLKESEKDLDDLKAACESRMARMTSV